MDNIKLGFFDLFGHVVPGSVLLFAFILPFNGHMTNVEELYSNVIALNIEFFIFYLFLSYITSTVFHQLGYIWFKKVGKLLWASRFKLSDSTGFKSIDFPQYKSYIREFSTNNNTIIEEWIAKRAMCYNLSFSLLILGICSLIKFFLVIEPSGWHWMILVIFSWVSSILVLHRARAFHDWYNEDIYNTILLIERKHGMKIIKQPPA